MDVVEKGQFGADMKVELLNDGPFTLMLESEQLLNRKSGQQKGQPWNWYCITVREMPV